MPELPEVERFRQLLAPLISTEHELKLERHSLDKSPPRKFLSDDDIANIHSSKLVVSDVLRKGKLICMILEPKTSKKVSKSKTKKYLMIHMGMTGRISNALQIPRLMELSDTTEYPPPHTYLKFVAGPYDACFSDPRKFGHVIVKDSMDEDFATLAPDAWTEVVSPHNDGKMMVDEAAIAKLANQKLGIKALLLDQNRAISGVGNYLADEVLYQLEIHPEQKFLPTDQAEALLRKLFDILDLAISCYRKDEDFPKEWIFHYRWSKGKKEGAKDCHGRAVTFVTSGGRTSAIVPSIQKLKGQKAASVAVKNDTNKIATKAAKKEIVKTATKAANKKVVETMATTDEVVQTESVIATKTTKPQVTKKAAVRKRKADESSSKITDKKIKTGSRKSPRLSS
jgi:formamidopyrimidine-DNA glycosylase